MHASIYESIYAYVRSCVCMYVCVCVYKRASMGDYVHLYMCVCTKLYIMIMSVTLNIINV